MTHVYVARSSFTTDDGEEIVAGQTRLSAGHPLLNTHADEFERTDVRGAEVEQTTAAPGERRNVSLKTTDE